MEGKTVIAIAHRLSTIAQLDRLVVIDAGNLIESGSHDELVQNSASTLIFGLVNLVGF